MMQLYSVNDLIRFLYHETTTAENHGITYQLEDDGDFNASFQDMLIARRLLDELKMTPSKKSVSQIIECSKMAV